MLLSKSITLLSICASALAAFNNETATYAAPEDKTTTTLAPVTSVEAKTTTWTLSDDTTTSFVTFTFYQTHTLSAQTPATITVENKEATVTDVVNSSEETTYLTSTLYSTITQGYSNSTYQPSSPTSAPSNSDSNIKTVYVTLEPVTSYITITADPVTSFVTITADSSTASIPSSQAQWSNNTNTN
ncbi:similar to Saccharomyces cerevisiae YPL163C SVS1 Cell wall and vacuolar protein, required for wild-type resistance to vanadate [Maudiozyma saulgeensis]|uniref:Similar to Saccharomyces cerevisiae YPL163C SVS1 Cell wall and vacuolar protein, required for wild-type resistance to vanadate n=1 Tax=Maudiozyma saulgeensis TaxID=1789683 RepID=A0A1X7R4T3_9SACH|nr:similar to Saccharomyces cerevisiae YPL163C SVS1 Cell wall and vacuolar protein, required for wild-type resistance to vanadate [Kazachstania saulgeensis]